MTALQTLELSLCHPRDSSVAPLHSLTSLRCPSLRHCRTGAAGGEDAGLELPGRSFELTHLDLAENDVRNADLAVVCRMTGLAYLSLASCQRFLAAGLAHLACLTTLRELSAACVFDASGIGSAGVIQLSALTGLSPCDMTLCRGDLAPRTRLCSLGSLRVSLCQLQGHARVEPSCALSALTAVNLTCCQGLCDTGLAHEAAASASARCHWKTVLRWAMQEWHA